MASRLLPILTLFLGDIITQAERAPRVEVNGVVGGTGLLSVTVPPNLQVDDVNWKFVSAKKRLGYSQGREFMPNNLSNTNYSQLIQRLDMYNEATLRIRNLTKGDSGIYKADVQFNDKSANEEEFQLSLYDPVPDPQIKHKLFPTSQGCNLTLECLVPYGMELNYTWFTVDQNDSRQYQKIAAGSKVNLSLYLNISHSQYFCVVTNPVEQKNTSIFIGCPKGPQQDSSIYEFLTIPFAIIFIIVVIFFICKRKKPRQRNHDAVPPDNRPDVGYKPAAKTEDAVYENGTRRAPNGMNQAQNMSGNRTESEPEEDPDYLEVLPQLNLNDSLQGKGCHQGVC